MVRAFTRSTSDTMWARAMRSRTTSSASRAARSTSAPSRTSRRRADTSSTGVSVQATTAASSAIHRGRPRPVASGSSGYAMGAWWPTDRRQRWCGRSSTTRFPDSRRQQLASGPRSSLRRRSRPLGGGPLPKREDELPAQDVARGLMGEAPRGEVLNQLVARVVCDVLVGVGPGHEEAVQLLRDYPFPVGIVRRAEDEPATRPEDPYELGEYRRLLRDVLYDLRAEHTWECAVGEGQGEPRALHQQHGIAARVSELAQQDVERDASGGQRADDAARPAPDVRHPPFSGDEIRDEPVALPLPVALQGDGAVVSARVVVGAEDRVAQLPEVPKGAHIRPAEPDHPGV